MPATGDRALSGIKVLDLTRFPPGAYCTVLLADLGADVVRVDTPGANTDVVRQQHRHRPRQALGRRRLPPCRLRRDACAASSRAADVVVDNARPGIARRARLRPGEGDRGAPALIWCSITGFGQDGPYANWPGHDLTLPRALGPAGRAQPGAPVAPPGGPRDPDRRAHGGHRDHHRAVRPRAHRRGRAPRRQPRRVGDVAAQRQRGALRRLGVWTIPDRAGAQPLPVQRRALGHHRGRRAPHLDRAVHRARPRRPRGRGTPLGRRCRRGDARDSPPRSRPARRPSGSPSSGPRASRSASCTRARRSSTTRRSARATRSSRSTGSPCPRTRSASVGADGPRSTTVTTPPPAAGADTDAVLAEAGYSARRDRGDARVRTARVGA